MKKKIIEFQTQMYGQSKNDMANMIYPLTKWVEAYNRITALPNLLESEFSEFALNPNTYYEKQVEALKQAKFGNDPIAMDKFKELYNIPVDFQVNVMPLTSSVENLEYVNGSVEIKESALAELKEYCTITTTDPKKIEQLEAIEALVDQYNKVFELCLPESRYFEKHLFTELGYDFRNKQFKANLVGKFTS